MSYKLCYRENATPEEEKALLQGIIDEAAKAKEMSPITPFSFFLKDAKERVLAGIKGTTLYGSLYIDLLWVAPQLRGKGWGKELVTEAEKLGKARGCTFSSLTTMDWEALGFYQKLGYAIEFVKEGFEKNSKMYVLRKSL